MKTKVIVHEIKQPPVLKNPAMTQGIRDTAAAKAWGEKNGHAIVYFLAKKRRVYAERLHTKVDEQAREIEAKSMQLVMLAENK